MGKVIALCAGKGAPGVTTTALLMASSWPRPAVLVEADPSGGSVALRAAPAHGPAFSSSPALLTLATAARSGEPTRDLLVSHAQTTRSGVQFVRGLDSTEQAKGLASLWPALVRCCRAADQDVIIDVGRVDSSSPTLPLLATADIVVMIAGASMEGLVQLRERLSSLGPAIARAGRRDTLLAALVAPARTGSHDVASAAQVLFDAGLSNPLIGFAAYDPAALDRFLAGNQPGRRVTAFDRSVRSLVSAVDIRIPLESEEGLSTAHHHVPAAAEWGVNVPKRGAVDAG